MGHQGWAELVICETRGSIHAALQALMRHSCGGGGCKPPCWQIDVKGELGVSGRLKNYPNFSHCFFALWEAIIELLPRMNLRDSATVVFAMALTVGPK